MCYGRKSKKDSGRQETKFHREISRLEKAREGGLGSGHRRGWLNEEELTASHCRSR